MKNSLIKLGTFIRLLDEQGKISITNIAIISVLSKVLLSNPVDTPSLIAFFMTLLNYSHKRHENLKSKKGVSND